MTDGTTVATINPVLTETEMSLITRLANFVVQSSDLHNKFPTLEAEIASMRRQLDHEQTVARDFSEQLIKVGQERDEAKAEAKAAIDSRIRVETDYQQLQAKFDRLDADFHKAHDDYAAARKDRDDAQFKVLELTEEVDKLKAKLAKFHAILADDEPKPLASPPVYPLDLQKDSDDYIAAKETEMAKAVEVTDHNPPSAEPVTVTEGKSEAEPTGYVPFATSDAPSVTETGTSAPTEPAEDRVYLSDVGGEAFWDAQASSGARWDSENDRGWYYVKPKTDNDPLPF